VAGRESASESDILRVEGERERFGGGERWLAVRRLAQNLKTMSEDKKIEKRLRRK